MRNPLSRSEEFSTRAELRLEILKEVLENDRIVAPEVGFESSPARLGNLAGRLEADLLNVRYHWRLRVGIRRRVDEFYTHLDLVDPVPVEHDHALILGRANVTRILVHGRDVEVVLRIVLTAICQHFSY